jgi:hypothetical protein
MPHGDCDCPAHRREPPTRTGWWATLIPVLACALCPACLGVYAQIFSAIGVGFELSSRVHAGLLVTAVVLSIAVGGWRASRMRWAWPIATALAGCTALLAGHFVDVHLLEWSGLAILVVGGLLERRLLRRRRAGDRLGSIASTPIVTPIVLGHLDAKPMVASTPGATFVHERSGTVD